MRTVSFEVAAEILSAGRLLAADLAAAGISPGDRVAVQMGNTSLYVDLLAAAAVGRFVLMAVNQRFAERLAESLISRSGARLVIRSAGDLPAHAKGEFVPSRAVPTDRYAIFTTSGTTSEPKLVVHQQRSVAMHAADVAAGFEYSAESVVMVPVPLCGVFGFTMLFAAFAGNTRVILPMTSEPAVLARLIEEHRVTSIHASDDLFHRMLATDHDLSSITNSGYPRFNSSLEGIVERCDARGVPLAGLYGMSEVLALYASRCHIDLPIEERWHPGGELLSPQARCRVVDGELQLQGPSLFEGYLADGGAEIDSGVTSRAFDGPWFRTGDLADDEGDHSFRYINRIGDVMRLSGFLVSPIEIETTLLELDSIDDAQVVAVELESGNRPVAFVIAAPGATVDEAAAIAHCRRSLATFKSPIRVITVDAFPVTDGPNGVKIQRAKLRDLAKAALG